MDGIYRGFIYRDRERELLLLRVLMVWWAAAFLPPKTKENYLSLYMAYGLSLFFFFFEKGLGYHIIDQIIISLGIFISIHLSDKYTVDNILYVRVYNF